MYSLSLHLPHCIPRTTLLPPPEQTSTNNTTQIGFCGGIGTGLFVGTGAAYARAGPAGLLLAYLIVGGVLWCMMQSIAELAVVFPVAGAFPHWATRFIDPAVGFSLAISYGYGYAVAVAQEVAAAAIIVSYWTDITPAVVITVGLVLILAINLCSVRVYGDTECFGGAVKVLCFVGLIFVSLVITCGGAPNGETIGFRYWRDPGPWVEFNGIQVCVLDDLELAEEICDEVVDEVSRALSHLSCRSYVLACQHWRSTSSLTQS